MVIRTLGKNLRCLSCVSHIIFLLGVHTHIDTHPRTQIISNHTRTQTHTFSLTHTHKLTLFLSLSLSLFLSLSLSLSICVSFAHVFSHTRTYACIHTNTQVVSCLVSSGELTFARKARYVFCVQSLPFVSI